MQRWVHAAILWSFVSFYAIAAEPPPILYKPPAARPVTNWTALGCSQELNAALQAYESDPSMKTALGVLKYFKEFAGKDTMREKVIAQHHDLMLTINLAKYEMVLHTINA